MARGAATWVATRMGRWPSVFLATAALLIASESTVVYVGYKSLFLSTLERERYWGALIPSALLLALSGTSVAYLVNALRQRKPIAPSDNGVARFLLRPERAVGFLLFVVPLGLACAALTEGRRVRDLPGRWVMVLVLSSALAWLGGEVFRRLLTHTERGSFKSRAALGGATWILAVAFMIADAEILPRLYPAFHALCAASALALLLSSATLWVGAPVPQAERSKTAKRRWTWLVPFASIIVFAATTAFALNALRLAPNASFVVEQYASVTGEMLRGYRLLMPASEGPDGAPDDIASVAPVANVEQGVGLDLRDRSVLLITIDALRADVLAAYGGDPALTPEMNALAAEGAVFLRAYAPTPHTSYSLASLLTGKYLHAVMSLPGASTVHPTLPEVLRQYGMRTSAFYPPAVFYVDGDRLSFLRDRDFGFEYVKEEFGSTRLRERQLRRYLGGLSDDEQAMPLFAWVHLFEPHEPYEPHERFPSGDSPRARYNGEVQMADEGVGRLVRLFRAARPDALVIVTADHGEEFGDHGGYYHGTTLYDEQARVPLLWAAPGLIPAAVHVAPVETIDIATTILAGVRVPREARMRGDDLGPLLIDPDTETRPAFAFSEVTDLRMITDGRHKAICRVGEPSCLLFDLRQDAGERLNLAGEAPETLSALRRTLGAVLASIPSHEALAMEDTSGWPTPLARAALGDRAAAAEVLELLVADDVDSRPAVRAAAARLLGDLGYEEAIDALIRIGTAADLPQSIRAESDISVIRLLSGQPDRSREYQDALGRLRNAYDLLQAPSSDLQLRAALALGEAGYDRGARELLVVVNDLGVPIETRRRAIDALAEASVRSAVPALIEALPDVRVRRHAVRALGTLGDPRAIAPIHGLLARERYIPARTDEAAALARLGHTRLRPLLVTLLGSESSCPGGLALLAEKGWLNGDKTVGGQFSDTSLRNGVLPDGLSGDWDCSVRGCQPGESAAIEVGAQARAQDLAAGEYRLVLLIDVTESTEAGHLRVAGRDEAVQPGQHQVQRRFTLGDTVDIELGASPNVRLLAWVAVPVDATADRLGESGVDP